MASKKPKTELVAICKLEFYRKQKNWKFCSQKREAKDPNKKRSKSTNAKLNQTYNIAPAPKKPDAEPVPVAPEPAEPEEQQNLDEAFVEAETGTASESDEPPAEGQDILKDVLETETGKPSSQSEPPWSPYSPRWSIQRWAERHRLWNTEHTQAPPCPTFNPSCPTFDPPCPTFDPPCPTRSCLTHDPIYPLQNQGVNPPTYPQKNLQDANCPIYDNNYNKIQQDLYSNQNFQHSTYDANYPTYTKHTEFDPKYASVVYYNSCYQDFDVPHRGHNEAFVPQNDEMNVGKEWDDREWCAGEGAGWSEPGWLAGGGTGGERGRGERAGRGGRRGRGLAARPEFGVSLRQPAFGGEQRIHSRRRARPTLYTDRPAARPRTSDRINRPRSGRGRGSTHRCPPRASTRGTPPATDIFKGSAALRRNPSSRPRPHPAPPSPALQRPYPGRFLPDHPRLAGADGASGTGNMLPHRYRDPGPTQHHLPLRFNDPILAGSFRTTPDLQGQTGQAGQHHLPLRFNDPILAGSFRTTPDLQGQTGQAGQVTCCPTGTATPGPPSTTFPCASTTLSWPVPSGPPPTCRGRRGKRDR
ncbi:uncharacterized protein LOC134676865 [Cydia fagiglandana]|uniref:uncharacterized protein LOC134676865 n=1 Tax=Cydia fagiglandana TaxID=1458189 RepID=UPI002FEDFD1E